MQSMADLCLDFKTDGLPVEKSGCSLLHRTQRCRDVAKGEQARTKVTRGGVRI